MWKPFTIRQNMTFGANGDCMALKRWHRLVMWWLLWTLSFTTCVDVAVGNGATVYPYRFKDASAVQYAQSKEALLAGGRGSASAYSLSPVSLAAIPAQARLVLPSPNGSALTLATGDTPTLAGCLRNGRAVADYAGQVGASVAVIPCGERWPDESLRPAIEDWIGAGAIIQALSGTKSPEAQAAQAIFESGQADLLQTVMACSSGKELVGRGFAADVVEAARLDCSSTVARLVDGAYINQKRGN